jgi:hypothetical protein
VDDTHYIRVSIGQTSTGPEDVHRLWRAIGSAAG